MMIEVLERILRDAESKLDGLLKLKAAGVELEFDDSRKTGDLIKENQKAVANIKVCIERLKARPPQ